MLQGIPLIDGSAMIEGTTPYDGIIHCRVAAILIYINDTAEINRDA